MTNALRLFFATPLIIGIACPAAAQQAHRDDNSAAPSTQTTASTEDTSKNGLAQRIKRYFSEEPEGREETRDPEGFYPRIGGLATGSGLALGGGYRKKVLSDAFYADMSGVISTKRYVGLDGRLRLPSPTERVEFWGSVALRRLTQEDYFGLGSGSTVESRANYGLHSVDVTGQAIFHVTRTIQVGSNIGYFMPTVKAGTDSNFPTVQALFGEREAPGLDMQPDFLHYGVFAALDYRDLRRNPRSGGIYEVTLSRWDDRQANAYDFNRFDVEAIQYIPLTRTKRHVVVGRAGVSLVNNDTGERVPFYVFPYVGGARSVRSLREFRFRDENAMYFTGEFRFGIIDQLQAVAFLDHGKVAASWQDIDFSSLERGWGVGLRAGTRTRTLVTLDVGTGGGEGTRVFLKFFPTY